MKTTRFLVKSAIALAIAAPLMASAESQLTIGSGSASADLNFRVVIPRVLFLAVGTGAAGLTTDTTVDTVTFDYTSNPADVGTGNVVPVRVLGNNGVIALASSNTGALTNGTGDTLPWSEITATSSDATNFASPPPAGGSVNLGLSQGTKVTSRTANWTFSYANTTVAAPGTYGVTNGTVTYTATMP